MNTKDFARKIFSLRLWGNLAAMAVVCLLVVFGVKFGLDIYTHHGEEIVIPDVRRMSLADAEQTLTEQGLQVEVTDTGYVKTAPAGSVLEQQPAAGRKVKFGRVVELVINSAQSPLLTLPDIIDNCSYREARAKLVAMGFRVGLPEYVSGEKDWVYGVKSNGHLLATGQKVSVDQTVIIQVGDGLRDGEDPFVYADPSEYEMGMTDSLGLLLDGEPVTSEPDAGSGEEDDFVPVEEN